MTSHASRWPVLRQFHEDAVYFGGRIGGAGDLAADDEIVRAVADGLRGRGDALLIAGIGSSGTDAGSNEDGPRGHDAADGGGFERGGDQTIDAEFASFAGAVSDEIGHGAGPVEIVHIFGAE